MYIDHYWVKINRGCVRNDQDARWLHKAIVKSKGNSNTDTGTAMWFDFDKLGDALKFIKIALSKMPYLEFIVGQSDDEAVIVDEPAFGT